MKGNQALEYIEKENLEMQVPNEAWMGVLGIEEVLQVSEQLLLREELAARELNMNEYKQWKNTEKLSTTAQPNSE